MRTRITARNRITLPTEVAARFIDVDCFDVTTNGECIVLRLLSPNPADDARIRLAVLGIDQKDVDAAVSWTRRS